LLSVLHTIFWGYTAFSLRVELPTEFPYNYIFPVMSLFSAIGLIGVFVGLGLFNGRNWARTAILALAGAGAFFCVFAMAVVLGLLFISGSTTELALHRDDSLRVLLIYFLVFLIAVWWIILFSRQRVAAQFSSNASSALLSAKGPSCPPPIALLAWLMIASGTLSALSWPLILGKIPAMLYTHIFSPQESRWIWGVNTILFLACGIGLLKLQRWSYSTTIALHVFWLTSLFVTQLSPLYIRYRSICLGALSMPNSYIPLGIDRMPQWASALFSAIPTGLLIAGLFYYRPAFVKVVADSRRLSS
jgi:hypothetical protein